MTDNEALQGRIYKLIELDEYRRSVMDKMEKNQEKIKGMLDHKERQRNFKEVDHLLILDKRKNKP
jgi:hypothetical protein